MAESTLTAPAAVRFYETGPHHPEQPTLLGFWLYLMSDCLLFACLFACYGVLGRNYAGVIHADGGTGGNGAVNVGWDSALVLTGISTREEADAAPRRPTFVLDDLAGLLA